MKNIGKHLKNFGFKSALSYVNNPNRKNEGKFYKTLRQHLGDF
jgi:hypothetical protein